MTDLVTGTKIKDNDPRTPGRVLVVRECYTSGGRAFVAASNAQGIGKTRILRRRIFMDDKPRRTGWSVVREI